jgi:hypothetical protein
MSPHTELTHALQLLGKQILQLRVHRVLPCVADLSGETMNR